MCAMARTRRSTARFRSAALFVLLAAPGVAAGDGPPAAHWAFRPLGEPRPPRVARGDWPRTALDAFILGRLEREGIAPSPPAPARVWLRRAVETLTGLPAGAEELEAFAAALRPDARERALDRLLASPRYGERWGRHWLDLARYSDTKGYVYDRDERRFVHSHVYRDWVIGALNQDLPYDRFVLYQLAADRLVEEEGLAREHLAAMGFLTLGRRFLGVIHDIIDDRIDVVGRGLMGLTLACARCHDHKFDPIPMADYYSLYGIFANSTEKLARVGESPAGTGEEARAAYELELRAREEKLEQTFESRKAQVSARLRKQSAAYLAAALEAEKFHTEAFYAFLGPDDLNPVVVRQWAAYLRDAARRADPVFAPWHALTALPAEGFAAAASEALARFEAAGAAGTAPPAHRGVLAALRAGPLSSRADAARIYGALLAGVDERWQAGLVAAKKEGRAAPAALPDPDDEALRAVLYDPGTPASVPPGAVAEVEWFFEEPQRVELAKLQADIERWHLDAPGAAPHAVVLADRARIRDARILQRGDPASPGAEAPRQFLAALSGPERRPFRSGSGRLDLARAIVGEGAPLAARVMANRVWQHHFGAGLANPSSDFGIRCEAPAHPELLEDLARRFIDGGWSLKRLHLQILASAAFAQDSAERRDCRERDPENRLVARAPRRRADYETLRDGLLAASGELDLTMGGSPVDLGKSPTSGRRSVYGLVDRQFLPSVLRSFDFANPDEHCGRRHETTVPQQALYLLNNEFVAGRARALAARAEVAGAAAGPERIRALYRLVFGREPEPRELELGLAFAADVEVAAAPRRDPRAAAWSYGFGEVDEAAGRLKGFTPLPHFSGEAWQGGAAWPDAALGWVRLDAGGGHAGNDRAHAAVRRWTAPRDGAAAIRGVFRHPRAEGDGIRGFMISSRAGILARWDLHHGEVPAAVDRIEVRAGDTLDFVVDLRDNLNWDIFEWAPIVSLAPAGGAAGAAGATTATNATNEWSAAALFLGPGGAEPLDVWERYAQVLFLSNEFAFVD
jgi:hypothetical protein